MSVDFSKISLEELEELEADRQKYIPNMMVETKTSNPFINELRFNFNFIYLFPFLVGGMTGDKLELRINNDEKIVWLNFIGVSEPKQGRGTKLMENFAAICDKYGYTAFLQVDPKFGVPKRVLVKFYKRFGFEKDANHHDDRYFRKPRTDGGVK